MQWIRVSEDAGTRGTDINKAKSKNGGEGGGAGGRMSWNVIEGKRGAEKKVVGVLKYREVRRLNISI
jgi:hypothetical protein